jgi:hypothetical protein
VSPCPFNTPVAEVFTDANLERSPTQTFQPPNSTFVATTAIQLDQTGNPAFLELLGRLKTFFAIRGIDVTSLFSEFDNHNSGLVSASQFRRQLPPGLALSDADVETLIGTLGRDGAVDYQALKNREPPPTTHTRAHTPPTSLSDAVMHGVVAAIGCGGAAVVHFAFVAVDSTVCTWPSRLWCIHRSDVPERRPGRAARPFDWRLRSGAGTDAARAGCGGTTPNPDASRPGSPSRVL